jgi:ESS family glutamate:Na+ symporter
VVGLLAGTVSLVGGHGTAIAWAPIFAERYGIANAIEIGIACATMGLILASLMGGPIARFLISRHGLPPADARPVDVGVAADPGQGGIDHVDFFDAVLAIHVSVILGLLLNDLLAGVGLKLPLFVTCLF